MSIDTSDAPGAGSRHERLDLAGPRLEVEAGDDLAVAARHRLDVLVDVGDRERHDGSRGDRVASYTYTSK